MYVLEMRGIAKGNINRSMPLANDLEEARSMANEALVIDGYELQPFERNPNKWLLWKAEGRIGIVCEITQPDYNPLFDAAESLYKLAVAVGA